MDAGSGDLLGHTGKLKTKNEKVKIKNFYDFILDLIFPKYCVGCGQEGFWICPECQKKIVLIKKPTCPNCHRLTKNGRFCPRCRKKSYLTSVLVAAYYQEGPLKEAIHTFKYEGVFDLKEDLGNLLIKTMENANLPKTTIIIPVPLHRHRQAMRGYNQAELLAKIIGDDFHFPLAKNILTRKKTKHTQVELSGKARRLNVQSIFSYTGENRLLKGKTILLVDDIYTTGATLQECAKVLRRDAGAKRIWGIVLAKA